MILAEETASRVYHREKLLESNEAALDQREGALCLRESDCDKANNEIKKSLMKNQEGLENLARDRKLLEQQRMSFEEDVQARKTHFTKGYLVFTLKGKL